MSSEIVIQRLRRFLLILAGLALLTTLAELWLQDHYKSLTQLIPWGLGGVGLVALLVAGFLPRFLTLWLLRLVMAGLALGGLGGMLIHLIENFEFQRDIHPGANLSDIWLATLKGAAPLLAPGALVFAALIAIAATWKHPLLTKASTPNQPEKQLVKS